MSVPIPRMDPPWAKRQASPPEEPPGVLQKHVSECYKQREQTWQITRPRLETGQ